MTRHLIILGSLSGKPAGSNSGPSAFSPARETQRLLANLIPTGSSPTSSKGLENLRLVLGDKNLSSLRSISQETSPELFYEELFFLGLELKTPDSAPIAQALFQFLAQSTHCPEKTQGAAQHQIKLLAEGNWVEHVEQLSSNFLGEATDPKMIVPMMAGSMVFRLGQVGTLVRLMGRNGGTAWWSRGMGVKSIATGVGFAGEVGAFTLASRQMHRLAGDEVSKDPKAITHEILSTSLTLGILKSFSGLGHQSSLAYQQWRQLGKTGLLGIEQNGLKAIPQVSGYLGLVTAQVTEEKLELRPEVSGSALWLGALSTHLALGMGAKLGHQAVGKRVKKLQQEISHRAQQLGKMTSEDRGEGGGWTFGPQLAFAGVRGVRNPVQRSNTLTLTELMMSVDPLIAELWKNKQNGTDPKNALSVLADQYGSQGDPRGEWIMVGQALAAEKAKGSIDLGEFRRLTRRYHELGNDFEIALRKNLGVHHERMSFRWENGFLVEAHIRKPTLTDLLALYSTNDAVMLDRIGLLDVASPEIGAEVLQSILSSELMDRVRHLKLRVDFSDEDLTTAFDGARVSHLEGLDLSGSESVASIPWGRFSSLTWLNLGNTTINTTELYRLVSDLVTERKGKKKLETLLLGQIKALNPSDYFTGYLGLIHGLNEEIKVLGLGELRPMYDEFSRELLKFKALEGLEINCNLSPIQWFELSKRWPNLKSLSITNDVIPEDLRVIVEAFPNLEAFSIHGQEIGNEEVRMITVGLPKLRKLDISGTRWLGDGEFGNLGQLDTLIANNLLLNSVTFSEGSITKLSGQLPNLTHLEMYRSSVILEFQLTSERMDHEPLEDFFRSMGRLEHLTPPGVTIQHRTNLRPLDPHILLDIIHRHNQTLQVLHIRKPSEDWTSNLIGLRVLRAKSGFENEAATISPANLQNVGLAGGNIRPDGTSLFLLK